MSNPTGKNQSNGQGNLNDADFKMFCDLYPTVGPSVGGMLSEKRSLGAMRSLAFRHGVKFDRKSRKVGHGMVQTRTYKAWFSARQRCTNPNNQAYRYYGGAGVKFHEPWNDFLTFLAEVGEAPSSRHHIDRIKSADGYVPGNVRWATPRQNSANTRSTNSTGVRGVDLLPSGRFRASICFEGKKKSLGVYDTAKQAGAAYDEKAIELFGEFALTNDMDWSMPDKAAEKVA